MKHRRLVINLVLLAVALLGQIAVAKATRHHAAKPTKFTVRIENISTPDGQTASDGTKWSFALSPGLWVLNDKKSGLFTEGKPASKGLESQAEDGDPSGLVGLSRRATTLRHCTAYSIRQWERRDQAQFDLARVMSSASQPIPE